MTIIYIFMQTGTAFKDELHWSSGMINKKNKHSHRHNLDINNVKLTIIILYNGKSAVSFFPLDIVKNTFNSCSPALAPITKYLTQQIKDSPL